MLTIKETTDLSSQTYTDALIIRKEVFVTEQRVPLDLEIENEDVCIHFVLYDDNQAQATVRLFPKENGTYKVQRMAVSLTARKKGFGREIMVYAEEFAKKNNGKRMILGAQTQAIPFYESLGYTVFGEEYLDAGIKHFDMEKEFR